MTPMVAPERAAVRIGDGGPAPGSLAFDWAMVALMGWGLGGLYWDGWAHNHFGSSIETFFTPWHGAFFSGIAAAIFLTCLMLFRNHARGYAWRRALPDGYNLTLVGEVLFFLGALSDLAWHAIFGIEASVEALLSPTHLLGADWRQQGPMLLSLTALLSVLSFFLQFVHPFERQWAAAGNRPTAESLPVVAADPALLLVHGQPSAVDLMQAAGISAILVTTATLMGVVLLIVRRWGPRLVPGGITLILGLNALGMGTMPDQLPFVPAVILGGLVADALLRTLRPSDERVVAFRCFAMAVPMVLWGCYFATLSLRGGIWWTVHLWAGSLVLAGVVGLLLSYAFLPPPTRDHSTGRLEHAFPSEAAVAEER